MSFIASYFRHFPPDSWIKKLYDTIRVFSVRLWTGSVYIFGFEAILKKKVSAKLWICILFTKISEFNALMTSTAAHVISVIWRKKWKIFGIVLYKKKVTEIFYKRGRPNNTLHHNIQDVCLTIIITKSKINFFS